jgi:hypothetical protein
VFAVAQDEGQARAIAEAIRAAFTGAGLESQGWICALDPEGARIIIPGQSHSGYEAHP